MSTDRDHESQRNHPSQGHEANVAIAKAYVSEMLELNPMYQASQIIRRRREMWRGSEATPVSPNRAALETGVGLQPADERLRSRARRCLTVLQTDFYQLPQEKLDQYLGFLSSRRLPEYAATSQRLRAVANCRDILNNALAETNDPKFAYSLQQSLVRPPADAGHWQEKYIMSIIAERRVPAAIEMIGKYKTNHPQIYALQRDWFDVLLDPVNRRAWSRKYSPVSGTRESLSSLASLRAGVVIIMLLIVVRGAVSFSSNGSSKKPQSIYSRLYQTAPSSGSPTLPSQAKAALPRSLEKQPGAVQPPMFTPDAPAPPKETYHDQQPRLSEKLIREHAERMERHGFPGTFLTPPNIPPPSSSPTFPPSYTPPSYPPPSFRPPSPSQRINAPPRFPRAILDRNGFP